jgi:hypothetical protein
MLLDTRLQQLNNNELVLEYSCFDIVLGGGFIWLWIITVPLAMSRPFRMSHYALTDRNAV